MSEGIYHLACAGCRGKATLLGERPLGMWDCACGGEHWLCGLCLNLFWTFRGGDGACPDEDGTRMALELMP